MLRNRNSFELRLQTHVLDVLYDRKAKRVTGVRYIDRLTGEEYEQPADIVVLSSFTMSNTKFLLTAGIGTPYNPKTGQGMVGKNFCHQTMSGTRVFFKDRWINPFLASGASQTVIDEFNGDNFDHSGLLLRRRLHLRQRDERTADYEPGCATRHAEMGRGVEK